MNCFEQTTRTKRIKKTQSKIDKDSEKFVIKEFTKLETCIFNYMNTMLESTEGQMSEKDVMRITKADSNYFIKQWGKLK